MGTDFEQDWINQYLSALSISLDKCVGSTMHILAGDTLDEPDYVPVSAPLVVEPSMAPSFIYPPHPPSEPASPSSLISDNSSDEELGFPGFRVHEHEQEPLHTMNLDHSVEAFGKAVPSPSPSSPTNIPQLPVWLPVYSPQWTQILATRTACEASATDDLIRVVEEDVSRLHYFEDIESLRKYNRQAMTAGLPLAPIPNVHGSKAPPGYNYLITSVSQITTLSAVELGAWLEHYGLSSPQDDAGRNSNRSRLAAHLGLGTLLAA